MKGSLVGAAGWDRWKEIEKMISKNGKRRGGRGKEGRTERWRWMKVGRGRR